MMLIQADSNDTVGGDAYTSKHTSDDRKGSVRVIKAISSGGEDKKGLPSVAV
jgi:hypothetical protein